LPSRQNRPATLHTRRYPFGGKKVNSTLEVDDELVQFETFRRDLRIRGYKVIEGNIESRG